MYVRGVYYFFNFTPKAHSSFVCDSVAAPLCFLVHFQCHWHDHFRIVICSASVSGTTAHIRTVELCSTNSAHFSGSHKHTFYL